MLLVPDYHTYTLQYDPQAPSEPLEKEYRSRSSAPYRLRYDSGCSSIVVLHHIIWTFSIWVKLDFLLDVKAIRALLELRVERGSLHLLSFLLAIVERSWDL